MNPFEAPNTPVAEMNTDGEPSSSARATRGDRLLAQVFDGLVLVPGLFLAFMVLAFTGVDLTSEEGATLGMFIAGLPALVVMVYQWYLIATTGQSLGKRWRGIEIVRQDGRPIDFVHGVVLRIWVFTVLGWIPVVGTLVSLIDPLMIFGEKKRCVHDLIAKTDVVELTFSDFEGR